jgi:hypothetical protein
MVQSYKGPALPKGPTLLLCDIDSTVSDSSHRAHLVECAKPDWEAFLEPSLVAKDPIVPGSDVAISNILVSLDIDRLFFVTGRNEGLREVTEKWLLDHGFYYDQVFMRALGNRSMPSKCKEEIVRKEIFHKDEFRNAQIIVIDDDPFALDMYAKYGCMTLLAPDCWKVLNSKVPKEDEQFWRR